jgi:hypothetical protein
MVFILFYRTISLLRRHRHQVARPQWRLHRHRHQVARPLCSSGVIFCGPLGVFIIILVSSVVFVKSLDLPPASSSSSSGRSTILRLHRCLRQVARPPSSFVVAFIRSLDLPSSPSSPSLARKTSPGFYVGNEGLHVGCAPNGPAKYFRVLGRFLILDLPKVGMPRVALPDSLQLCKISGCLYTPYVQDQQISSFIVDRPRTSQLQLRHHRRPLHATRLSRSCWVSSDIGHHRLEASLRSTRLQRLLEVGPARLLAAMLGDLGVSTLRMKTMT